MNTVYFNLTFYHEHIFMLLIFDVSFQHEHKFHCADVL